jgi:ubiquinone/menaquinone biosynthesis C-methylase UbiE
MASSRSERIRKARRLLQPGIPDPGGIWADLGCGDGIFTAALYSLVGPQAQIYAVDKKRRALGSLSRNFARNYPQASVQPVVADFTQPLPLPSLDGIVMANALHFVDDKLSVTRRLASLINPNGRLIIVEYNAAVGNWAVPYPLDKASFIRLAEEAGLKEPRIVAIIPSSFLKEMYAGLAFVRRPA